MGLVNTHDPYGSMTLAELKKIPAQGRDDARDKDGFASEANYLAG